MQPKIGTPPPRKLAELREKLELAKDPGDEKAKARRDKKGIPERACPHPRAAGSGQLPGDRCAGQDPG